MKKILYAAAAVLVASVFACTSEEQVEVIKSEAPKVVFGIQSSELSVLVDSTVRFDAELVEGLDAQVSWFVDEVLVARTPSFSWTFNKVGKFSVHFNATNELGSVEKTYEVNVSGVPLKVSYSVEESSLAAVVGTELNIDVTVTAGDKSVQHSWMLDGKKSSTNSSFSYTFKEDEVGTHILVYEGENVDGMKASRSWTINVRDLPLEFSFSPADESLSSVEGQTLSLSATVLHGSKGLVYSWMENGKEVGTESSYTFKCSAAGMYTISFKGINGIGETVSKTWTVTVEAYVESSYMVENFESETSLPSYISGNNVGGVSVLSVVDNPFKTETNPSEKVLVDDMTKVTWGSSGYVKLLTPNKVPAAELSKYSRMRVKVYVGVNAYVPYMLITKGGDKSSLPVKVNGADFYPTANSSANWEALIKHNDWNILEYSLIEGNYNGVAANFGELDQVQFRVTVVYGNSNCPAAVSETNTKIVYLDDFELLD